MVKPITTSDIAKNITFSIDDENVAKITKTEASTATVKFVGEGTTKLKVALDYNGKTYTDEYSFSVVNTEEDLYDRIISGNKNIKIGETSQLKYEIGTGLIPTRDYTSEAVWSSSNEYVATVDKNGLVTGLHSGSTTITATYTQDELKLSAKYDIKVEPIVKILDMKLIGNNYVKANENLCINLKTSEEIDFVYFEILNNGHYYGYECELNNSSKEYNILFNANQLFSAEASIDEYSDANDNASAINGYCHIENVAIRKKGGDWTTYMTLHLTGVSVEYLNYNIEFYIDNLPLTDVKVGSWYYNSVKYVYEKGIMTGLNETTFAPNNNLTRGMMVTLLYRMDGTPEVTGEPTFPDVQDSNKYYYKAVKWAADNKIVSGYANGRFGPTDNITRAQLAVILYNYAEYKSKDVSKRADLSGFPDNNQVASWAQNAVKWAIAEGIISGNVNKQTGVKTIDPRQNATRAQVASMMERYCKNVGR